MEKAKLRIEKRGTVKYGYILLAFLRMPFQFEELVKIADNEEQMELRIASYRQHYELEVERKYA